MNQEKKQDVFIYGAGITGKNAYGYFGPTRTAGFIDGSPKKQGTKLYGIPIYSLEDVLPLLKDKVIVLTMTSDKAPEVIDLLESHGIYNYALWFFFKDFENPLLEEHLERCRKRTPNNISTDSFYLQDKLELYTFLYKQEKNQLLFTTKSVSPSAFHTPDGPIREKQKAIISFAAELCKDLEFQDIHPFLTAGNLLGYVRHQGGFLPWDDDLDYLVIRPEFEKLKSYFSEKYPCYPYDGPQIFNDRFRGMKAIREDILRQHVGETIFLIGPRITSVLKCDTSRAKSLQVDFFSMDSYRNGYSFSHHKAMIDDFARKLREAATTKEQFEIIDETIAKDRVNYGDAYLFFGPDNMQSYAYYNDPDDWLQKEDIFPLQRIKYDGYSMNIPSHPDKLLAYIFGPNFMKLPLSYATEAHV